MHVISCRNRQISVGVLVKRKVSFHPIRRFPSLRSPSGILYVRGVGFLFRWQGPLCDIILHSYIQDSVTYRVFYIQYMYKYLPAYDSRLQRFSDDAGHWPANTVSSDHIQKF